MKRTTVLPCSVLFALAGSALGHFLIDRPRRLSWGFTAMPIQAGVDTYQPGEHTFYGRYFGGTALDQREPLPTTTAARFFSLTSAPATAFFVWRETSEAAEPYPCVSAGPLAWDPLTATNLSGFGPIIVFDEEENPYSFGGPRPPYGDFATQQSTIWLAESDGRYTVGLDAFQLDTANNPIIDNP